MTADITSTYITTLKITFQFKTDESEEGFVYVTVADDSDRVIDFQEGFVVESEFVEEQHRQGWIDEWLEAYGYKAGGNWPFTR